MILITVMVATLIIAVCLPVLGQRVLERRVVFVDLALAQLAATGYALGMALHIPGMIAAAGITAVAVFLMALMDENTALPKEAVMGGVYAFAASAGVVLLSVLPYGEGQLMGLLFGSILGVDWMGILRLSIFAVIGTAMAWPDHGNTYGGRLRFYIGLSLIIVPAIHAIGVLLVFAYLVMPALSVWRHGKNGPAWQAITLAAVASVAGVLISDLFDLPPSATVVLTLTMIAVLIGIVIYFIAGDEKSAGSKEKKKASADTTANTTAENETPESSTEAS
ncbi:MAG: metal ABC transporter permease [Mariprofundaceae bacterium]